MGTSVLLCQRLALSIEDIMSGSAMSPAMLAREVMVQGLFVIESKSWLMVC